MPTDLLVTIKNKQLLLFTFTNLGRDSVVKATEFKFYVEISSLPDLCPVSIMFIRYEQISAQLFTLFISSSHCP